MPPLDLAQCIPAAALGAALGFIKPLYFIRQAARARTADAAAAGTTFCRRRGQEKCRARRLFLNTPTSFQPACSTGYGAAMTLQSALALALGRAAGADLLGRLHLGAVAAYGVRLAAFVLWRERLPSFQRRKAASDAKLAGMSLGKASEIFRICWRAGSGRLPLAAPEPARAPLLYLAASLPSPRPSQPSSLACPLQKLGMWAGVVPLYTAMFVPAFLNSAAGAGAGASAAAKAVSLVSLAGPLLPPPTANC